MLETVPQVYVDCLLWTMYWYHESVKRVPHMTGFSEAVDAEMAKVIQSPTSRAAMQKWTIDCAADLDRLAQKYGAI